MLKAVEQGGLLLGPALAIFVIPPSTEAHARDGGGSTPAPIQPVGVCKAEISSIESVKFVAENFDKLKTSSRTSKSRSTRASLATS